MKLLLEELEIGEFEMAKDCRDTWDVMKEEDLQRYYLEAYGYTDKKKKVEEDEEDEERDWKEMLLVASPALVGSAIVGIKKWLGL